MKCHVCMQFGIVPFQLPKYQPFWLFGPADACLKHQGGGRLHVSCLLPLPVAAATAVQLQLTRPPQHCRCCCTVVLLVCGLLLLAQHTLQLLTLLLATQVCAQLWG